MELLARCSLEESKKFDGRLVIPNEDSKKPDKVLLNVCVSGEDGDSLDSIFSKLNGREYCVSYRSSELSISKVPDKLKGKVFNEISLEELNNKELLSDVDGVVNLLNLPKGYCDMFKLKEICDDNPGLRVMGGNLLGVEGVRIGRFDNGKDKMSPVFCDIYDTFVEVDLNDLEGLKEIVKKTRKKAEGAEAKPKKKKKGSKSGGSKRITKSREVFSRLFGSDEEEEF